MFVIRLEPDQLEQNLDFLLWTAQKQEKYLVGSQSTTFPNPLKKYLIVILPSIMIKTISIVLPTYNEKENIKILIPKIESAFKNAKCEIIIVDDSSPDGTAEVAKALNKKFKNIKVIIDGRNCLDKDKIKSLDILYHGIGRY